MTEADLDTTIKDMLARFYEKFDKQDTIFDKQDGFFDKQDTKFYNQYKELVNITLVSTSLSEDTKVIKEEYIKFSSKLNEHEKNLSSVTKSFGERL